MQLPPALNHVADKYNDTGWVGGCVERKQLDACALVKSDVLTRAKSGNGGSGDPQFMEGSGATVFDLSADISRSMPFDSLIRLEYQRR